MIQVKAKMINLEDFAKFGTFTNIYEPSGYSLGDFYQDRLLFHVAGDYQVAFSPQICRKPEHYIVSTIEYHNTTGEVIFFPEDDGLIYLAPPSKTPVPELTEAFIIPKGTIVQINVGVWHYSPFALNKDGIHAMVVLPERIYNRDCCVIEYREEHKIEILVD